MDNLKKRELNFWINILSPLITIAFTIGVYTTTVSALADRVKKIEDDHIAQEKTYLEIQIKLAEIQKDIAYIKSNLEDLKN